MNTSLSIRQPPSGSGNTAVTRQRQPTTGMTDPQKWLINALLSKMACESISTNSNHNFHDADRALSTAADRTSLSPKVEAKMKAAMFNHQILNSASDADIGMALMDRAAFCATRSGAGSKAMTNTEAEGWAAYLQGIFIGASATPESRFTASPYSPHPSGYARPVTAKDVLNSWQDITSFRDTAQHNELGVNVSAYWDLKQSNRLQKLYAPGGTNGISLNDPEWIRKSYQWINSVRPDPDDFAPGALERHSKTITDGTSPAFTYGVQPTRLAVQGGPSQAPRSIAQQ
jgi:hypothetical protein